MADDNEIIEMMARNAAYIRVLEQINGKLMAEVKSAIPILRQVEERIGAYSDPLPLLVHKLRERLESI